MKTIRNKMARKLSAVFVAVLLLALCALPVAASDGGVPQVVLDTRSGVLRIVSEGEDFMASGTGFAVGSEKNPYIITNYHVVEDSIALYLYYDTGEYVEGRVYKEYPDRDLAVIKPAEPIPDMTVLTLADQVDSGQAVYALGFPGAADTLADGFDEQEYGSMEEFLNAVVADKQSMTITNGIVSAIRTSKLIGFTGKDVEMVQTNAAINNGNSGGPLLNSQGHVVGVNTIGLSGIDTIEAMNGSVHVDELARVLKRDGVPYTLPSGQTAGNEAGQTPDPGPAGGLDTTAWIVLVAGAVVVLGCLAVIIFMVRRNRKTSPKREMTMLAWERGGLRMAEVELQGKMMAFLQELASLDNGTDLYALLTPENIQIGPKGISLKKKKAAEEDAAAIKIYPGYSAPESYDNRSSAASSVYFLGAMMAMMLTGQRPENAMRRKESGTMPFPAPDTMQMIVNEAMQPGENQRLPDLYNLQMRLGNATSAIQYENGYVPAGYGGYQ